MPQYVRKSEAIDAIQIPSLPGNNETNAKWGDFLDWCVKHDAKIVFGEVSQENNYDHVLKVEVEVEVDRTYCLKWLGWSDRLIQWDYLVAGAYGGIEQMARAEFEAQYLFGMKVASA